MKLNPQATHGFIYILAMLVLAVAIFWIYHPTINYPLVWDSIYYLVDNPYISDFSVENLKWMFTTHHLSNWHPATWVSYSLDFYLYGGLSPSGFHLTNIILHALNSIIFLHLILLLLRITYPQDTPGYSVQSHPKLVFAAFIGSLFFAIHPQHVESVAWVAERKDLLFLLFMQLSFIAYLRYIRGKPGDFYFYLVSIILFALSLASKPMAVTFPIILLIADFYPLKRLKYLQHDNTNSPGRSDVIVLLEKIPFLILSFITIALTLSAQQGALEDLNKLDITSRIFNAFNSIMFYLQKTVIPVNYSPYYPYADNINLLNYKNVLALLGFLSISLIAVYLWRKGKSALIASWVFYLVTLSPVMGIIQVGMQAAADRYTYLTTIPVYLFLSAGTLWIMQRTRVPIKLLSISLIILTGLGFSYAASQQVKIWSSPVHLWQHASHLFPHSGHIHGNLASAWYKTGNYSLAAKHYETAIKYGYFSASHLTTAAMAYIKLEKYQNALTLYKAAVSHHRESPEIKPVLDCIRLNMGLIYLKLGQPEKANSVFGQIPASSEQYHYAHQIKQGKSITAIELPGKDHLTALLCTKLRIISH